MQYLNNANSKMFGKNHMCFKVVLNYARSSGTRLMKCSRAICSSLGWKIKFIIQIYTQIYNGVIED
jgi:hypothetical protein